MHYLAIMIHTDEILRLYFLVYKLTWTHEDSRFSPHVVLVGLRIFVSCLWSDQFEFMVVFMVLICGLVQVLFLTLVGNF